MRPTRLSRNLLAEYRPGALVAVAFGMATGIPKRRPRGYTLHAVDVVQIPGVAAQEIAVSAQVAVLNIRGVLEQRGNAWECGETCGYDTIEMDICAALGDPGVCALVISCDTPGGDVPGLEETVARIRAVADAIGKPVLGYCDELVASAGVWLMLGVCDALYLPPSGRVGSIGCAVVFESEARANAMDGIDIYVARSVPGKMKPNPVEMLDEIGKARLDAMAAEGAERFVNFIAARRGISPAAITAWNGSLFTGAAAVAAGLADGIGSLDDTITLAATLAAQPVSTEEAA